MHFQICQILKPAQALIFIYDFDRIHAPESTEQLGESGAHKSFLMRAPQQQLEVHSGTVCTAKVAAARTRAVVKNQALGRTGASDLSVVFVVDWKAEWCA